MNDKNKKLAKLGVLFMAFSLLCGCASHASAVRTHPIPALFDSSLEEQQSFDAQTELTVLVQGQAQVMTLERYLEGVLMGELPTDFSLDAMKAQAIASRTIALRALEQGRELSDDPSSCQAFRGDLEPNETAKLAVLETDGMVLTYQNELIDATFFSCSGGMTEDAVEVWGSEVPYLIAQPSPGEENAPRDQETLTLSRSAFLEALKDLRPLDETTLPLIGEATQTAGEGLAAISIGGQVFSGLELRNLFSLRSTRIQIEEQGSLVRITTRGAGHRVGMSQYGAQAMAEDGKCAQEILAYYYPGTKIKKQP